LRALLALALFSVAGCAGERFVTSSDRPDELVVQLRRADLPSPLTEIAVHYWFATFEPRGDARWHRFELWQNGDDDGTGRANHVKVDQGDIDGGVGGGPMTIDREFRGESARRLLRILEACRTQYPHRYFYCPWPGPNSNTFAAWVLRAASVSADLHPKAIGKDYLDDPGGAGFGAGTTTTGTGFQLETPLAGVKLGLEDGVELHFLCLTLGIDLVPPAIKTPVARLGFPE
jgi:hypothetical protein